MKKEPIRFSEAVPAQTKESRLDTGDFRHQLDMYKLIFNSIHNGCIVTDTEGFVTHFNEPYGLFLGVNPAEQIGKHCTEVVENTRMHIVAKTGKPEISQPHLIKGQRMVVQRIPIRRDGKVIAVLGQVMFKDVQDVRKLARKLSHLESKVSHYERELISLRSTRYTLESLIGESRVMEALKEEALKAAATQFPVLITGESGTGKEIFAQGIHHASSRKLYPFVRINCSAIPKDLLESELFGYEKGAFTGAGSAGKPGKFELAEQGTVFLDEIGDLPLQMQPKLLRVLEDKAFERVGGTCIIRSDFRLIAATNQDLDLLLAERRFRKDLFYRLNVIPLKIPPLRERREDIIPIARHQLKQLGQDAGLLEVRLDEQTEEVLRNYDWPGNVRELSNVLERVMSSLDGEVIRPDDLPFYINPDRKSQTIPQTASLRQVLSKAEKEAIKEALRLACNNKAQAARRLGIHRTLLYKKMIKHGISAGNNLVHG